MPDLRTGGLVARPGRDNRLLTCSHQAWPEDGFDMRIEGSCITMPPNRFVCVHCRLHLAPGQVPESGYGREIHLITLRGKREMPGCDIEGAFTRSEETSHCCVPSLANIFRKGRLIRSKLCVPAPFEAWLRLRVCLVRHQPEGRLNGQ